MALIRPLARASAFRVLLAVCCTSLFGGAHAQVLSYSAGLSTAEQARTYTWALAYEHGLSKHWAASLTWLNEGHIPNHHRDGQSVQLWTRLPVFDGRGMLEAGVGPYLYFDTTVHPGSARYSDEHGVGALMSIRASYALTKHWTTQLQVNRVALRGSPDSTGAMLGIGYRFDVASKGAWSTGTRSTSTSSQAAPYAPADSTQAVTLYAGQTILNSTRSPSAFATALDWRTELGDHLAASFGYLHESSREQARRDGVTTQIWARQAFNDGRFELSAGTGLYYAINEYEGSEIPGPGDGTVSALISISAAYRLSNRWQARLTWNRVATHYDRDTDVIVGGLGFRF